MSNAKKKKICILIPLARPSNVRHIHPKKKERKKIGFIKHKCVRWPPLWAFVFLFRIPLSHRVSRMPLFYFPSLTVTQVHNDKFTQPFLLCSLRFYIYLQRSYITFTHTTKEYPVESNGFPVSRWFAEWFGTNRRWNYSCKKKNRTEKYVITICLFYSPS